ncbi:SMI1/KNR4 family protein [Nonomuraea sp. H19]|uniref:SMI1/KNR4 family protein n=1 Tax=Nonomuraea sp. H19 TaxID=3452206 RepID=UPI003F8BDB0D
MLKLVRLALTTAILTAIAVRLRRRARMPGKQPAPVPPRPSPGPRMGLAWAAIAAIVAVTVAAALIPAEAESTAAAAWRAYQAEQAALTVGQRVVILTNPSVTATPPPVSTVPTQPPVQTPGPDCFAARRPVTVRPIDPKIKRAVDRQWRRIERWLTANAPRTYRTLGKPGRARTIAIAESQMGVDFPDDLRASLLRHNGMSGAVETQFAVGVHELWGVRVIRDLWREQCARDRLPGRLIPFGGSGLELDPDSGRVVRPVAGPDPIWPSYHAMLRDVADAVDRGGDVRGWRPVVRRGWLEWAEAP